VERIIIEVYFYVKYKTRYHWITKEKKYYLISQESLKLRNFFIDFLSYIQSSEIKYIEGIRVWKAERDFLIEIEVSSLDLFKAITKGLVKGCNFKLIPNVEGEILAEEVRLKGSQMRCEQKNFHGFGKMDILCLSIVLFPLIFIFLCLLLKKGLIDNFIANICGGISLLAFILIALLFDKEQKKEFRKSKQEEFICLIEQCILRELK